MNLCLLTKHLPEDIVKYILEFDKNIVIRNGFIHIINKIDKNFYKNSYKLLSKKSYIINSRTTYYNNETNTWAQAKLWNFTIPHLTCYISYSSNKDELKYTFCSWGKGGTFKKHVFFIP